MQVLYYSTSWKAYWLLRIFLPFFNHCRQLVTLSRYSKNRCCTSGPGEVRSLEHRRSSHRRDGDHRSAAEVSTFQSLICTVIEASPSASNDEIRPSQKSFLHESSLIFRCWSESFTDEAHWGGDRSDGGELCVRNDGRKWVLSFRTSKTTYNKRCFESNAVFHPWLFS